MKLTFYEEWGYERKVVWDGKAQVKLEHVLWVVWINPHPPLTHTTYVHNVVHVLLSYCAIF